MRRVSALEFLERYIDSVRGLATWNDFCCISRTQTVAYTDAMIESARRACIDLGLRAEAERPHRLDMTGFDPSDTRVPGERFLTIAFEHELGKQKWREELLKLIPIEAALKVLVGYEPLGKAESLRDKLRGAKDLVLKAPVGKRECAWLFILVPGIKGDWTDPWEAYTLDELGEISRLPLQFSSKEFRDSPY